MSFKRAAILVFFCFIFAAAAIPQTPGMGSQAASSQAGMANTAERAQINQLSTPRKDDAQAMRDDIKRMRALVQQMESNLAFVDNTQSPLKHQFQLEIDAWRILIDQMERRVQK